MNTTLAEEVGKLVDWGWRVQSQTDTTAALENRTSFRWLLFALVLFLFPLLGGLLYVGFWLLMSRVGVFLRLDNSGAVVTSGDVWFVESQRVQVEVAREVVRDAQTQGFWKNVGWSILSSIFAVVSWGLIIWGIVTLLD